jgi:hypothetical protein
MNCSNEVIEVNNNPAREAPSQPVPPDVIEIDADQLPEVSEEPVNKGGRKVTRLWTDFTEKAEAHKICNGKTAPCKHCNETVSHHNKILSVQTHMKRCRPFVALMNRTALQDQPEWYKDMSKKRSTLSLASKSCSKSSNPSKKMKNTDIRSYGIPDLTKGEIQKVEACLAMHYYCTGTSFQRIEDHYLLQAFRICRKNIKIPNRKRLSNDLLTSCYERVKKDVDAIIQHNSNMVTVTTDAWSNIKNEPVVNYMAVNPGNSLFLEAVNTEEQGHDAEWIAKDLERVMESLQCIVIGAITDNTATNKKAWKVLEEKFPSRFFHGCVAHGFHLFVKDIFLATKTVRPRGSGNPAKYPDDYPFEYLLQFVSSCKDIVTFFHNHHVLKAKLKVALQAAKLKSLVQMVPTRWGTIRGLLQSLLDADTVLNSIVSERDFVSGNARQKEQRQVIKDILTAPNYRDNLDKSLLILKPIDKWIKFFQSDKAEISVVYKAFQELPGIFQEMSTLSVQERTYLQNLSKDRFEFMYGDAHGIGYLLDPRYCGNGMSQEVSEEIEEFIFQFPNEDGSAKTEEEMIQISKEYTEWKIKALKERTNNTFRFKLLGKSKTILQYWQSDGSFYPTLQKLAVKVFSMPASSAASERCFSTFGFVHSKLRNSLGPEKVKKLVYVKINGKQLSTQAFDDSEDDNEFETSSDTDSVIPDEDD